MKLQGSIELRVIDSQSGLIKQIIRKDNIVPNTTLVSLLGANATVVFRPAKISISTSQALPTILNSQVSGIIATGYVPSGVTSPTWNDGVDPPFFQVQNRIDFVGVARTFWTVALTNLSSSNSQNNLTATALAYLRMDTSCTQGEQDYIDIYYRIQFAKVDGQNLTRQARYDFGKIQFSTANWKMSYLYLSCAHPPQSSGYNNLYVPNNKEVASVTSGVVLVGWSSVAAIADHFKFKYFLTKDLQDFVGLIFNAMLQGQTETLESAYTVNLFKNPKAPFQNGFWHTNNATKPFFDSLAIGTSKGSIELSGDWTGQIPELYKFTIVASGAVGTATYKWSVRKHLGFNSNSYTDLVPSCIYRNPNVAAHSAHHGWRDEDNDVLAFSQTQVVQYDQTGVTLLDVMTGEFTTWSNGNGLGATDIRQCATDGENIYVACRNTGLWIIDAVNQSVSNQVSTACYGVDVGREGKVYAIFNGRLSSSDNWNAPLPFTFLSLTDGNWARARFLKADPENVEDRLAIVADNGTGTNRVIWYRASTGTASTGTSSNVKSWPASLDVSDTGGLWAMRSVRLTWNTTIATALASTIPARTLTHSLYGADSYYKVSFSRGNLITGDRTINSSGTIISTYPALPSQSSFITELDGIVLMDRGMRQLYNNTDAWTDYGWDGSKWVVGAAGARPTHTSKQDLQEGIQVSFANAPSGTNFNATDFLTQSVNWGLLKDNATRFNWASQWYSKPAQLDGAAQGTIPPNAPYNIGLPALTSPDFVRIETNSPELHRFTIDGIPVATIYVNGEPPGPSEVSMKATGDGILTFNAADAGKEFQANPYAWVKN